MRDAGCGAQHPSHIQHGSCHVRRMQVAELSKIALLGFHMFANCISALDMPMEWHGSLSTHCLVNCCGELVGSFTHKQTVHAEHTSYNSPSPDEITIPWIDVMS